MLGSHSPVGRSGGTRRAGLILPILFAIIASAAPTPAFVATLLKDGRVLFTDDPNYGPMATGERYDPATRRFTPTGSMSSPRMHFTATRLLNGKVLVTGGCSAGMS